MSNKRTFGQLLSAPPLHLLNFDCTERVGFDKLSVICDDFRVQSSLPFGVQPAPKKAGETEALNRHLFTTEAGEPVYGSKAYLNTDTAQFTLKGDGVLTVQVNPSKVFYPKSSGSASYRLVTEPDDLSAVIQAVEDEARSNGLHFDFGNSRTYRLDVAKQVTMNRTVAEYQTAFRSLRMKYSKGSSVQHGVETFQYGSAKSNSQVMFYDKLNELLHAEHYRSSGSSNYLRAELRLLNAREVQQRTQARTPNELLKTPTEQLRTVYDDYLTKRIFYSSQSNLFTDEQSLLSLVKHFVTAQYDRSTKGAFKRVVQSVGVATICEDVGIERFIQLFGDVVQQTSTVKSEAVSRSLRRYRAELYKLADTVSALWKPVEVVELIQELRTALLVA
jgi:hypothetical protein